MARTKQGERRSGLRRPLAALILSAVAATAGAAIVPSAANAASAGPIKGAGSGRCIDVSAFKADDGVQLQIWDCNGGTNQSVTQTSGQQLQILGKCLQAAGTTSGAKVLLATCSTSAGQQWTHNSSGTFTAVSSGLCLDANGAGTSNGTLLQVWTCNNGSNQSWSGDTAAAPPVSTDTATSEPPVADPTTSTSTAPVSTAPVSTAPVSTAPVSTGNAPTHFSTLAVGATLPTGAQCAAWVRAIPIAEKRTDNAAQNARTGRALTASAAPLNRVDGQFTGTTEQILRWAACKWGIDEDMVKAQAVKESYWHMSTLGDFGTDSTRCATGHTLGSDGQAGKCPESIGILQVRYPYHSVSFPESQTSTAMNADYAYEQWYACYQGQDTWMTNGYKAGDAWGCEGSWFSGNWHDSGADSYIAAVKQILSDRTWEGKNF